MRRIIILLIVVAIAAGGVYFWRQRGVFVPKSETGALTSGASPDALAEITKYQYTETYTHPTLNFSFKYPKDFVVTNVPSGDGSEAILVQNNAKKVGVQILISAYDGGDVDMTPEIIKADIPDIKIDNPQEVLVGANRKGLAFLSNNEAFGGASREVWFIFGGKLYQISTYPELDDFLKGVFGTWQFK